MTGFSIDWLNLRESADLQARDKSLIKLAVRWLENISSPDQLPLILDLGSGTGSTVRSFDRVLDAESLSAHWRLIDNDPSLLSEASAGTKHPIGSKPALQIYQIFKKFHFKT